MSERIEFRRIGRASGFKLIVYVLIVPAAALLFAILVVSGLVLGIQEERLPGGLAACLLFPALFLLLVASVLLFAARDFRWRFPDFFALDGGRVEWGRGARRLVVEAAEIAALRVVPPECALRAVDGRGFNLRSEEWPVVEIRAALLDRFLPGMVERALGRMAAGETVRYGTPRRVTILALFSAVVVGLSGLLWLRVAFGGSEIHPRAALGAFMMLSFAAGLFRTFLRVAGHEVRLDANGLVLPGFFRTARLGWKEVEGFEEDKEGVRIDRLAGGSVRVERALTNYPVILALIRASRRDG